MVNPLERPRRWIAEVEILYDNSKTERSLTVVADCITEAFVEAYDAIDKLIISEYGPAALATAFYDLFALNEIEEEDNE